MLYIYIYIYIYIYFQKMSDKGSKALRKANKKIPKLVSKLNRAIESVKEQDILFTEVDGVRKLATNCFQFFLEHGVRYNNLLYFNIFFPF